MNKALHKRIFDEINVLTYYLIESGLADDQNLPVLSRKGRDEYEVSIAGFDSFAPILKNRPYQELHDELAYERGYNVKMLDGALIQMTYELADRSIRKSRLAFMPSPNLLDFQNNPEVYLEDAMYADVIDKRVVTVPLRFDFDIRPGVAQDTDHPVSHLTLGQYAHCRIATTAPLTPFLFVEFILRSFYKSALGSVTSSLPFHGFRLARCITVNEASLIHIGVPSAT